MRRQVGVGLIPGPRPQPCSSLSLSRLTDQSSNPTKHKNFDPPDPPTPLTPPKSGTQVEGGGGVEG